MHGETVNIIKKQAPSDYHCNCTFCSKVIGELRPKDGTYYSRLERRQYYDMTESKLKEGGHIAKTPLHVARWAIQTYSKEGDWVLDPTIGAGTTAVEALTQGRNVAGMELEYFHVTEANVNKALALANNKKLSAKVASGDARAIGQFLKAVKKEYSLIVNNPPYSGDTSQAAMGGGLLDYNRELPNLAFLKEGREYWDTMQTIYAECIKYLKPGGHFVIGIKDMMRRKEPFLLHKTFCEMMQTFPELKFTGTAFLKHYPTTLFLNTYERRYGVTPPLYQTISVFQKKG